jgi:hypothetical protein
MLADIDTHYQERAQRILTLICFSSQPLSVTEVIDGLAVDIFEWERYEHWARQNQTEQILLSSGCRHAQAPCYSSESVSNIHRSIMAFDYSSLT